MKMICRLGAGDASLIRLDPGKIRRLSWRKIQLATVGILRL
jgi:hypothetical protein